MHGKLILLRHGQSKYNAQSLFTGHHDPSLTAHGVKQAQVAARILARNCNIDFIIHSALERSISTAQALLPKLKMQPTVLPEDARLNERDYGVLSGKNKQQTIAEYGADKVHLWRRSLYVAPPGGESLADTRVRVVDSFTQHIQPRLESGKCVLVVAHGNSLRALISHILNFDDTQIRQTEIGCCSPWVISRLGNRNVVQIFTDDSSNNKLAKGNHIMHSNSVSHLETLIS